MYVFVYVCVCVCVYAAHVYIFYVLTMFGDHTTQVSTPGVNSFPGKL